MPYRIPYKDCTVSAVFETHKVPLNLDCRQGICKSCEVDCEALKSSGDTRGPGGSNTSTELVKILCCQEPCVEGLRLRVDIAAQNRAIAEKVARSVHSVQDTDGRVLSKYARQGAGGSGNTRREAEKIREIKERRQKVEDYVWLLDESIGNYEMERECLDGMEEALEGVEEEVVRKNLRHGGRANMLETFYLILSYSSHEENKRRATERHKWLMHLFYPGGIPPENSSSPSRDQTRE